MSNKLIYLLVLLLVLPSVTAATNPEIPTFQQNIANNLSIPCNFNGNVCPVTALCNTTIINPQGLVLFNSEPMTKVNALFILNLSADNLDTIGQYENTVTCCAGTTCRARELPFQVTPSGATPISAGQGSIVLAIFIFLFVINILLYFLGFQIPNLLVRLFVFPLAGIMSGGLIYYALLILSETLAASPSILAGLNIFLGVFRVLFVAVGLLYIGIIFSIVLKQLRIKSGTIDDD